MSGWKKLAAAPAGGGGLDVDEVFSTYLYTGTGSNRGISNGIALADGVGGGTSTQFDGSSDYLEKSFSESTRSQMTFSAWIYPEYSTSGKTFFRNGASTSPFEFNIQVGSDSNLDFYLTTGNQSKGATGTNKPLGFTGWHHILFSINTSTGVAHLYIDDADVGISNTSSGEDLKPLLNSFQIMKGEGTGRASGRVAHVFLDYTYRNLGTTSNRRLFIDANGGSTSPSTLSALNPIIYVPMTDAYSAGQNIGTGGNFTVNGSPTIVNNGTEYLSDHGQGGMVWIKPRSASGNNRITDTERGSSKYLKTNDTAAELTDTTSVTSFNSDGFSVGTSNDTNSNGVNTASWTFRKTPKFFDIVTYTGTGPSTVRNLSHDLGCDVGCLIVKRLDSAESWYVWHKGFGDNGYMTLNSTSSKSSYTGLWNNTAPTSTQFTVYDDLNATGATFIAYLWAHNNNDGEFGPDGDQDIIKCGGWSSSGSQTVNLGFEPQWILLRPTGVTANWAVYDVMRGQVVGGAAQELYPNLTNTEGSGGIFGSVNPLPTGFSVTAGYNSNHIYIAIRRGPLAVPESATDVFDMHTGSAYNTVFNTSVSAVDLAITTGPQEISPWYTGARLQGGYYNYTNDTQTELGGVNVQGRFDVSDGYAQKQGSSSFFTWMWKRAPGFFDVVTYTGNGTAGRTISHNLGVAPEMIWAKGRSIAQNWAVYNPNGKLQLLNQAGAEYSDAVTDDFYGNGSSVIAPTATEFTIGSASPINNNGSTYIAYLFATLAGESKVGSYTGNGSSQTINCGFSSGARFILVKRTDSTGDWYIWDTTRGIVAGNDPYLKLNTTDAEVTNQDWVDPNNSGFIVNSTTINASGGNYIFYAIA